MQHTQFLQPDQQPLQPLAMHPRKFIVWLFMVSIFMMFAGWTSAFLVARSEGDVLNIELPSLFTISTVLLVISSVTMHLAIRSARRDNLQGLKLFLGITLALGVVFLAAQWTGFARFMEMDIYFVGGTAVQSFMYVLPFMHGLHIIAGLIFVGLVLYRAYRFKVHSKNMLSLEMCATFWHFLDALWLYLFLFLTLNA
ncbi:cytochrome c oxidase subunit 3 [Cesiribacter andamanensis]|uniref:Quinol oxidase subunit 3 n=1 Tax=Cesiribacter andamanensis AMV16 TaxID=1279009 RepID=M7NMN1_9BACT|nr:cytochrome c oxidase subunit 3 [Cesiribacter andamanensis]EMR03030.1 Quinol oxidase subunit 3 [Cesiribacter andamanensis AMV16]